MSIKTLFERSRLLFIVLILGAVLSLMYPRFLTQSNLSNVLWSICVIGIMCTGAIYAPITGGIDLAVGSVAAIVWSDKYRLATYYVEYVVPPRATQVYFDRANTCFIHLTKEQIDCDYLLDTRLLHLSGLTVPLSPSLCEIIHEALRRANALGIPVSFDMNYRQRVWTPEQARATIEPMLKAIAILFCSRGDERQVFGIEGAPEEIVMRLGELTSAQYIVSSLSSDGLNRIGAGDAMVGGVLHGWLQNDFAKAIRYGALTAALALSQFGDQVVTTCQEVETLLDAASPDIVR